jgi:hypothetical protein
MTLLPHLDFGNELEFGDDAFASIGFRLCRFRLNWISAMTLLSHLDFGHQMDFGDDAFASIGFRR